VKETSSLSRRDEILSLAKEQIAERGYSDTSMRDIAEAAGLLAGSLYSHFKGKAELVRDIVIRFYDELIPRQRAILQSGLDGAAQFGAMVGEVFEVCSQHREELTILHYDWHTLSTLDEFADVQAQSLETLDLWRKVLVAGQRDGSIRPTIDTEAMIRIATSSVHALIDTIRYNDRPLPTSRTDELAAALQDVLLGGVATKRPTPRRRASKTAKAVKSTKAQTTKAKGAKTKSPKTAAVPATAAKARAAKALPTRRRARDV
jgi:TetR/AcrR family transcriptional regulator, cholesterol catabolism regulator